MTKILLALMLVASSAMADETRNAGSFQSQPAKYVYEHEISRVSGPSPDKVVDELLMAM